MKPVVVRSLNDATGQRCVDIVRDSTGGFRYVECRRDPEDPQGRRAIRPADGPGFATEKQALSAAVSAIGWLDACWPDVAAP